MSELNNKQDMAPESEDAKSTIFSDPEETASKKPSKKQAKKSSSALKKQRRTIVTVAAVTVLVAALYFVGMSVHKRHVKLGEDWDTFKGAVISRLSETRLDELDTYGTFAEWLAEHHGDITVKPLIERNEDILKILDENPRLVKLVHDIESKVKYANYIDDLVDDPEAAIRPIEGEVVGTSNKLYLFSPLDRNKIQSVKVKNSFGEFAFVYNEAESSFEVEGHPGAPFDQTLFSSLIVSAGKPNVITRLYDECDDFAAYGLADAQSPASYTVTDKSGVSQTVYIGYQTADGASYYARHAERNALYVLGGSLESSMLQPLESLISPMLTLPMTDSDYFTVENFGLFCGEDMTVGITYLEEGLQKELGLDSPFYMFYPTAYSVNSFNYSAVLQALASFSGSRTVVYNPTEEDFDKYGLRSIELHPQTDDGAPEGGVDNLPPFALTYTYTVKGKELEQWIYFSALNENGNYYAYSPQFDLIAEVDGQSAQWLEWELIKWVDEAIFMKNINDIATVDIEGGGQSYVFDISGTDKELTVTERNTGIKPVVSEFRKLYKLLLSTHLQGYVADDLTSEEISGLADGAPDAVLTVTSRAGKMIVYRFYHYSTLRTYYTVEEVAEGSEPVGEFYVMSSSVAKMLSDSGKLLAGETIDETTRS